MLRHQVYVVGHPVGFVFTIGDEQKMRQRPRLRIEDRALVLFVIIGRIGVYLEQNRKRDQLLVAQIKNVVRARLSQQYFLVSNVCVLEKLRHSLVEPERHPLPRAAKLQVRVLVINRSEWVLLLLGIETKQ